MTDEHYWFFLLTIAYYYPDNPSKNIQRKYYDFIMNLPLFIPQNSRTTLVFPVNGSELSSYLDKYPVSPYLVNRHSFLVWMNFIHNKINEKIGKQPISLEQELYDYEMKIRENIFSIHQPALSKESNGMFSLGEIPLKYFLLLGMIGCIYFTL